MSQALHSNPFAIETTRIRCGHGYVIIDAHADGEIVSATLVRGRHVVQSLRRAECRVLRTMLERLGAVVPYADFGAPKNSVRRDLRNLRSALEDLGLSLDSIPGVGYRLRGANAEVATIQIGDVRVDPEGRILHCAYRSELVGPNVLGVFLALSECAHDAASLYRVAWGGDPYKISDVVQARASDLRDVLRRLGSKCRIANWIVFNHGARRRTTYYLLERPDQPSLRIAWPKRPSCVQLDLFPVEQMGLFDDTLSPIMVKSRRVIHSPVRRVRQSDGDYIMVIA